MQKSTNIINNGYGNGEISVSYDGVVRVKV